jgi:hypothetical protein
MPQWAGARGAAGAIAGAIADRLHSPEQVVGLDSRHDRWPQSLAVGAAGVALLHIERARSGLGSWERAHDWLAFAAQGTVDGTERAHLHHGAPSIAFALHAAADQPGRYSNALATLDQQVAVVTRRRLDRAHARIDARGLPALAEFDAIRGLAGIGAHLLRRDPACDLLRSVLAYMVRLTEPITRSGELLPGWWSGLDPSGRTSGQFPSGHANHGMAHGIGGPLALLSLATIYCVRVDGQVEAISRICRWLDRWRRASDAGPWWPYWVTGASGELYAERSPEGRPARPSWCYGTAGLARAQQLAGIAIADTARQQAAEDALARALTEPAQLMLIRDGSLCHGFAGLLHIAARAAGDALDPRLAACVRNLLNTVVQDADADADAEVPRGDGPRPVSAGFVSGDVGLLEGAAGYALALHSAHLGTPPASGWDSCLLII